MKTLSKNGVDLMQSGFKGRGLKSSKDMKYKALCSSFFLVDYHIIIDIVDAPTILFSPIKSLKLFILLINGHLPLTFSRKTFYKTFYNKSVDELLAEGAFQNFIFKRKKYEKEKKTTKKLS